MGSEMCIRDRVQPTVDGSATCKQSVRILSGQETVRQILRWGKDVVKVLVGLNLTTVEMQRPIFKALMQETPWATFEQELTRICQEVKDAALENAIAADQINGNTVQQDVIRARAVTYYWSTPRLLAAMQALIQHLVPRQALAKACLLYTSPSPRDLSTSRMPSSA